MAYKDYIQRRTRAKWDRYSELRKLATKICRCKKRTCNEQILDIEKEFRSNTPRGAYEFINNIRKGYKPRTELCKDKDGGILGEKAKIKSRWVTYFEELLNRGEDARENSDQTEPTEGEEEEPIPPPTLDEVKAIRQMKNNKAPGIDGISAEIIKSRGAPLIRELHDLLQEIWVKEEMPAEWRKSIICPIYKKGDKLKCENYRRISLLCVAYKIFTKILAKRISPLAERIIGEYQGGFRPSRSTVDQLFTVKQILSKC